MPLDLKIVPYILKFKFDAGTSRGVLREKKVWFIKLWDSENPDVVGWGEAGPLKGLSVDDVPDFEDRLYSICNMLKGNSVPNSEQMVGEYVLDIDDSLPSVKFGVECALLDLFYGGMRVVIPSPFVLNKQQIVINGLIWMGSPAFMLEQIADKTSTGFSCLKLKIGSNDRKEEYDVLQYIRDSYNKVDLELRLDANGAYDYDTALSVLNSLNKFHIHSIEQPIKAGNYEQMCDLCKLSPIPIALDEELIGIHDNKEKREMLKIIKPAYIILKPSLLGGLAATKEWIEIAEELDIGWWITSALESNIGLNAICQLTSSLHTTMPQGLGTGSLYQNNIDSPLYIEKEKIGYGHNSWNFEILD